MARVFLGLGSNLHSPKRQLHQALKHLRQLPRTTIIAISTMHHSKPIGVRAQPNYINLVVSIQTKLAPLRLLQQCQRIEHKQRRIKKKIWGARTIDIDILLYDKMTLKLPQLQIPHPEMLNRDFVLMPLLELNRLTDPRLSRSDPGATQWVRV